MKFDKSWDSHLDTPQGGGEKRSEAYRKYGNRVPQPATQRSAKSASRVSSFASEQASAVRIPRIGVFDSGVGGKSVAKAIDKALPYCRVILAEDKKNLPYGNKTPKELYKLVLPILNKLSKSCDVILVACNTVSTTLMDKLREAIKTPLIAMEPMVKPAAELTKSKIITVCATPTTLASNRYKWLKDTYAQGVIVLEPDCSDWTEMIEDNSVDEQKIRKRIISTLDKGSDVIVLGCTHYHWIEELINEITGEKAKVLQPEGPVTAQLKRVLEQP